LPSSTCCRRIQFRNVSAFIPSRLETLVLSGPEVQLPITLLVAVSITDTLSRST
jgi:hypothetical protein